MEIYLSGNVHIGFVRMYIFMEIDWNIHIGYLIWATADLEEGYYVQPGLGNWPEIFFFSEFLSYFKANSAAVMCVLIVLESRVNHSCFHIELQHKLQLSEPFL